MKIYKYFSHNFFFKDLYYLNNLLRIKIKVLKVFKKIVEIDKKMNI